MTSSQKTSSSSNKATWSSWSTSACQKSVVSKMPLWTQSSGHHTTCHLRSSMASTIRDAIYGQSEWSLTFCSVASRRSMGSQRLRFLGRSECAIMISVRKTVRRSVKKQGILLKNWYSLIWSWGWRLSRHLNIRGFSVKRRKRQVLVRFIRWGMNAFLNGSKSLRALRNCNKNSCLS